MDSKAVNEGIKEVIWPQLRDDGFEVFSPRTAWRHRPERIDVINFQSFNAYNAGVIGCTTYSFAVNLGCFVLAIPPRFEPSKMKQKNGRLTPQEFECRLRGRLSPTMQQPHLQATDIWFIDEAGERLAASLRDVSQCIAATALPWFSHFASLHEVLRIFQTQPEQMSRLWGFGRSPSPVRHYFSGYVALSLNDSSAKHHLEQALLSGCFSSVEARLASDVQQAVQQSVQADGPASGGTAA